MSPGNYTLRVAGYSDPALEGQIFSNDTELFFDTKQVSVFIQLSKPFYRQGHTGTLSIYFMFFFELAVCSPITWATVETNWETHAKIYRGLHDQLLHWQTLL